MKKKNLVLLGATAMLSLALAGSLGAVNAASAENSIDQSTSEGKGTVPVTYSLTDAWKVTIPESITIGGQDSITVSASDVVLEKGKKLQVTVESQNEWKVKNGSKELEYELKKSESALSNGSTVLEVKAGTTTGSETLTANMKDTAANYSTGGQEYTDTLTFSAAVVEAE